MAGDAANDEHRSPETAALAALPLLVELAVDSSSLMAECDPVAAAELGVPFRSCSVAPADLFVDDPTVTIESALDHNTRRLYPVLVADEVVSSITVGLTEDGTWAVASMGSPSRAIALAAVRAGHAAERASMPSDYFVVSVPSVSLVFVGTYEDDRLVFGHPFDDGDHGFEAGTWSTARSVIDELRRPR